MGAILIHCDRKNASGCPFGRLEAFFGGFDQAC